MLLAVTEGYLLQEGRDRGMGRVKQCFVRGLRKDVGFWGVGQL